MDPKAFWLSLESAEARRRDLAKVTHSMRAKVQARVSANDEPELVTPADRALAEKFAGEPYELKDARS